MAAIRGSKTDTLLTQSFVKRMREIEQNIIGIDVNPSLITLTNNVKNNIASYLIPLIKELQTKYTTDPNAKQTLLGIATLQHFMLAKIMRMSFEPRPKTNEAPLKLPIELKSSVLDIGQALGGDDAVTKLLDKARDEPDVNAYDTEGLNDGPFSAEFRKLQKCID